MSPDKTQELINVYPDLFSGLDERNCFYLFSFECDDGWFDLLKDLIAEIRSIIEKGDNPSYIGLDDEPVSLKVSQVKEKYASLRFYTNWSNDAIDEAVRKAEDRSKVTCEVCGSEGFHRAVRPYWYKCLCEKCFSTD